MKKITLFFIFAFLSSYYGSNTHAQIIVASDNAGNYSSWADASNLGFGFGEWDLWQTNSGGWFLGNSSGDGFGDINTSSKAFGMWANPATGGNSSNAQRTFASSVWADGASFTVQIATAYRNGSKGIDLFATGWENIWNFNVGADKYTAGGVDQSWGYSQTSIFTLTVTQNGANVDITLSRPGDTPYTTTINNKTLFAFKLYISGTDAGSSLNNLYFNNLKISYSDWSKVPENIKVVADQSSSLAYNKTFTDLTVNSGVTLTLNADKQLSVSALTNNGTLTAKTGATIIPATVSGSGTYNVEQALASGRQWWYLSSPLSAATSNVFSPTSSANKIGDYTESTTSYSAPFTAGAGTALTAGKGYVVKLATTDGGTYTFTGGSLNNDNVSLTPTRTGTTASLRGFNLIGNPFLAYLNWDQVYNDAATSNIRNAIWYRTYAGGVMTFHTYADGDASPETSSPYIAPMQGFWIKVHADNSNGALPLKTAYRSHFAEGKNPLKVKALDARPRLRLQVTNGTTTDETLIVGKLYASNALDYYDIEKMSNSDINIPEIYSVLEGQELVINSMNELTNNAKVLLGFRPGQAGNFKIKVNQLDNISSQVVLKDNLLNSETELTLGTEYTFASDVTSTVDRFAVEFKAPAVVTSLAEPDAKSVRVFVNNENKITVQSANDNSEVNICVYSSTGQLISSKNSSRTVTTIDENLQAGVYLIRVNQFVQKVVVK